MTQNAWGFQINEAIQFLNVFLSYIVHLLTYISEHRTRYILEIDKFQLIAEWHFHLNKRQRKLQTFKNGQSRSTGNTGHTNIPGFFLSFSCFYIPWIKPHIVHIKLKYCCIILSKCTSVSRGRNHACCLFAWTRAFPYLK